MCSVPAWGLQSRPLKWIEPRLTRLVGEAPTGSGWLHEIKYDVYQIHARIDSDSIKPLTRTGLHWSHRYRRTIKTLKEPPTSHSPNWRSPTAGRRYRAR
jgi:bifunctional non-homologous end joining protein LigD